jgi:hypothetical protein
MGGHQKLLPATDVVSMSQTTGRPQMDVSAKVALLLSTINIVTPALAAQGPGVAQGTASPLVQTLWSVAAIALVVFLIAGVVRGAVCYWRGARR